MHCNIARCQKTYECDSTSDAVDMQRRLAPAEQVTSIGPVLATHHSRGQIQLGDSYSRSFSEWVLQGTQAQSLKCGGTTCIALLFQHHMTRPSGFGVWRASAGQASLDMPHQSWSWRATTTVVWHLGTALGKLKFGILTAQHAHGSCGMCTRGM